MHPWTTNDEAPLTQQVNAVQTDTENDAYTARIVTKSNKAYVASIVTENNVAYCNKAGSEYTTIIGKL